MGWAKAGWVVAVVVMVAPGVGCRFGTSYIPVFPGDLNPGGCVDDEGKADGREVPIGVVFWPAPGVTAFVFDTSGPSSVTLFDEECDGELTWTGNDLIAWRQVTAADPLVADSCFDP